MAEMVNEKRMEIGLNTLRSQCTDTMQEHSEEIRTIWAAIKAVKFETETQVRKNLLSSQGSGNQDDLELTKSQK